MSKIRTAAIVTTLATIAAAGAASAQQQEWIVPFPYPSALPASSATFGYMPPSLAPASRTVTTTTFYQAPAARTSTVTTVRSRPRVYGYRAFPARTVTTRTVRAPMVVNNYYYQSPAMATWFQPMPWVFGATQTAGW